MTRTRQDTAIHRANQPSSLQVITPTLISCRPQYSRSNNYLGRALLLCREVVKSVEPFLFLVALLLFVSFLLKFMASPLHFLLYPIQAFILRKLRNALALVLLTSSFVLLGFLFNTILMNGTSAAREERPCMSKRKRKGKKKKKKAELISNFFFSCADGLDEITPDFSTLISKWLFESSDDSALGESPSSCDELEAEDQKLFEEDEGQLFKQPQIASAQEEEQEEEEEIEEEDAFSACSRPQSKAASYYRSPLQTNGSAASTNRATEINSEVPQIERNGVNSRNKHSRSRSYTSGLNLHDGAVSTSSTATNNAAVPNNMASRRRASLSCDWGSRDSNSPLLQNSGTGYADLRSPPLPPFVFNYVEKGSSDLETALVLQRQLTPWRVSSDQSSSTPRTQIYNEKAAERPNIIDYSEVFGGDRRSRSVARAMGGIHSR